MIYKKIKNKLPQTEVVMISSDHKLEFLSRMREWTLWPVMIKDNNTVKKLKQESLKILRKRKSQLVNSVLMMGAITFVLTLIIWGVIN
ncbi:MAG: hypothetical protein IH948_00365 [Bacteroidetes bacterium]|nr:hypothetical protein [Bacteroidota bacterium]